MTSVHETGVTDGYIYFGSSSYYRKCNELLSFLIKCFIGIINNYALIVFKCYILSKQHMKKWPWRLGYLLRQLQNTDVGTNLLR